MTRKSIRTSAILLLAIAFYHTAFAQSSEDRRIWFGVSTAAAYNLHSGDFKTFDGIQECGQFSDAKTLGWLAGNVLDFPLSKIFSLSGRAYYYQASGAFTTVRANSPLVLMPDSSLSRAVFQDKLDVTLNYLTFDVLGRLALGPVYLALGPSIGFPQRASYIQTQSIVSPQSIAYRSGGATRQITAGAFTKVNSTQSDANIRIAGVGGLGMDIPLSTRFELNPEVSYSFGGSKVLGSFNWSLNAIRAGIGLKMAVGVAPATQLIVHDTFGTPSTPVPKPQPIADLNAENITTEGVALNYAQIDITDKRSVAVIPLLPYVFFDKNSGKISDRYALDHSNDFSERSLPDTVMTVYHQLLNIIGQRMTTYPTAKITLTGAYEPLEDTQQPAKVARERADAVKTYIVEHWNIAPARIAVQSRALPRVPSVRNVADGREENRRAEITTDDLRILAPVRVDVNERHIEPATVKFMPAVQFAEPISKWTIDVHSKSGELLWSKSEPGMLPHEAAWNISNDLAPKVLPASTAKKINENNYVDAHLAIEQSGGRTIEKNRQIPIHYVVQSQRANGDLLQDSINERYNLMLFDFDSPKISDFNRQVIDMVQSRIRTNSVVHIAGYTDRIGDNAHNLQLSKARAESAGDVIEARVIPAKMDVGGLGKELIYPNDLPEGRFYNRTVLIEVISPASND